jgi:hypothetical protein
MRRIVPSHPTAPKTSRDRRKKGYTFSPMNLVPPIRTIRYSWIRISRTNRLRTKIDVNRKKWLNPGNKLLKTVRCPKTFETNPSHLAFQ